MSTEAIIYSVGIAIFIAGMLFGGTAFDESWQRDCRKIGAHVSDGKVFKCYEAQEGAP